MNLFFEEVYEGNQMTLVIIKILLHDVKKLASRNFGCRISSKVLN